MTHLNEQAVAAFADGVLAPPAHARAVRHLQDCLDCANAVAAQREAAWAIRVSPTPRPSGALLARLYDLPATTDLPGPPTTLLDGRPVFAAFGTTERAPLPPVASDPPGRRASVVRTGALLGVAAAALTFGGSMALAHDAAQTQPASTVRVVRPAPASSPVGPVPATFTLMGGH